MVDKGPALVHLQAIVEVGPHDDVAVTIAVDVAGRAHGEAEAGIGLAAFHGPIGRGAQAAAGAVVDQGPSLPRKGIVVAIGPHDEVAVAIAVDVAGRAHGEAKEGALLVALGGPIGGR